MKVVPSSCGLFDRSTIIEYSFIYCRNPSISSTFILVQAIVGENLKIVSFWRVSTMQNQLYLERLKWEIDSEHVDTFIRTRQWSLIRFIDANKWTDSVYQSQTLLFELTSVLYREWTWNVLQLRTSKTRKNFVRHANYDIDLSRLFCKRTIRALKSQRQPVLSIQKIYLWSTPQLSNLVARSIIKFHWLES